ncbi:peroxidase 4-like [Magnolia sinica]|uniref:peroxidase 4-like n=1 Tax=Magnolia sinica TaxID=86752 RepID=UPI0026591706|nr:peroxidase 4-like [Magnolia sinica]
MAPCISMFLVTVVLCARSIAADLSPNYYSSTCPKALDTVQAAVVAAVKKETRMGASLLRLHFHDCFVNGCDGSILLDDNLTFTGEKTAIPNVNSVRGFDVVDDIKSKVEKVCLGVVSCADILALAARDSVVMLGGPSWEVPLGRRDSTTANRSTANTNIPPPTSNLSTLITSFSNKGLSVNDLVALSGSHTIGLARCTSFRSRIYNDSNIDATFADKLQTKCPMVGRNNTLACLDVATPKVFDNCYFRNLLSEKGLLHSDQELMNKSSTSSRVNKYVSEPSAFFKDFAKAMVKMGKIKPLIGNEGQIRLNCRKVN